ncbi:hypothetical protein [Aequorivita echinoideorum]|uniref:Tetratricopeptide repeat-containing protein n=1 Tax=Aequorivita echinoideorum TaxID=1549647 RepID=A0ABS5S0P7_9FLAO|nr:hypothetical protein [Aequorivita echinoideorum]MBT0606759.1 hypothetical protein [Aequorivita echinoideorum]
MNISNFTYLLANPQKLTDADLHELNLLIQKYPYFQSARALQLKGLKNNDSFMYNDALKITAAHTTDRDILFEYITSEKFIQNEISQIILQHDASVNEIQVFPEDVSLELNEENEKKHKAEIEKAEAILNPNLFQRKIASFPEKDEQISDKPEKEINIQPDKPLEFKSGDTHSFSEWLKLTRAKPIERTPEAQIKDEKERKFELIDKFIQENPKILPSENIKNNDKTDLPKSQTNLHLQPTDSLMTETLAKVYLQQKNYKKAIQAYKILILKNPEKSGFFADQIRAIEKLINQEHS